MKVLANSFWGGRPLNHNDNRQAYGKHTKHKR